MTKDERGEQPPQREDVRPKPAEPIVTPDNEPSALKRGARIFERLTRKPGRD